MNVTGFKLGSMMALSVIATVAIFMAAPAPASAQVSKASICEGTGGTWTNGTCVSPTGNATVTGTFRKVANVLIFIVGAVSVLMVIIGGLRYVLSNGEQSGITSAKNTVLYALLGVAVAFIAYAIVNFVLTFFKIT